MGDHDLNERPGEALPQPKLENPGETKTKQKRTLHEPANRWFRRGTGGLEVGTQNLALE